MRCMLRRTPSPTRRARSCRPSAPGRIAPQLIAPQLIAPQLIAPQLIAPLLIAPLLVVLLALLALGLVPSAMAWSWPVQGAVLRPYSLGPNAYAAGQHRGVDV